jgi:putative FmdB family regulatory protein
MPLYEYSCRDCGRTFEVLVKESDDQPTCPDCGATNPTKLMSAPSTASGLARARTPGPGDTTCCGSTPGRANGCAGPGSCCGGGH